MSFIGEILDKFSIDMKENVNGYKITVINGVGALVEGHRGVIALESHEVKLRINKSYILIKGESLKLKEIGDSDAYIVGKIVGTEIVRNER